MIDLDKAELDIVCPVCGFGTAVTLKEIQLESVLICRGCKSGIKLVDQMGELSKAVQEIEASLSDLSNTIKMFGRRK
jgi:hypothetical protein